MLTRQSSWSSHSDSPCVSNLRVKRVVRAFLCLCGIVQTQKHQEHLFLQVHFHFHLFNCDFFFGFLFNFYVRVTCICIVVVEIGVDKFFVCGTFQSFRIFGRILFQFHQLTSNIKFNFREGSKILNFIFSFLNFLEKMFPTFLIQRVWVSWNVLA